MGRTAGHILAAFALVLVLLSCGRKEKLIPRSTMSLIYADMFLADQWLIPRTDEFKRADTMRFYEPIFEKYGYTTEDYCYSVSHYLKDPRRFAKVIQKSSSMLVEEHKRLEEVLRDRDAVEGEIRSLMGHAARVKVLYDTSFFAYAGSHAVDMESDEWGVYLPRTREYSVDSLPPADTLAPLDSLKVPDLTEDQEDKPEDKAEIAGEAKLSKEPVTRNLFKRDKERPRRPSKMKAPDGRPSATPLPGETELK